MVLLKHLIELLTNGKVTNKVIYLSAIDEEDFVIAQANADVDDKGTFKMKL